MDAIKLFVIFKSVGFGVIAVIIALLLAIWIHKKLKRDAARAGYDSVSAYLESPPRSDREKRDAVDLGLKGLAICVFGLILTPLLIIGVFPLFFGLRKIAYASLGLGLVDDGEENFPLA